MSSDTLNFCAMEAERDDCCAADLVEEIGYDIFQAAKAQSEHYRNNPEVLLREIVSIFDNEDINEEFGTNLFPKEIIQIDRIVADFSFNSTKFSFKGIVLAKDGKKYNVEVTSSDYSGNRNSPPEFESEYLVMSCVV